MLVSIIILLLFCVYACILVALFVWSLLVLYTNIVFVIKTVVIHVHPPVTEEEAETRLLFFNLWKRFQVLCILWVLFFKKSTTSKHGWKKYIKLNRITSKTTYFLWRRHNGNITYEWEFELLCYCLLNQTRTGGSMKTFE